MTGILSSDITPTEAATYHNIMLTVIGITATIILAETIKDKTTVPVRDLAIWAGIFGIVTAASVYSLAKASK